MPIEAPENTIASFRAAHRLGADGVELDVRLTRDGVAIVHHNYYVGSDSTRPVFALALSEIRTHSFGTSGVPDQLIPTLEEVLEEFGGSFDLEIEMKGPEPEAAAAIAALLLSRRQAWDRIEVTSWHGALLRDMVDRCPGLRTALLFPATESWMRNDVIGYAALHHARAAGAAAVHLWPDQLNRKTVGAIRSGGIDPHAHMINSDALLRVADELEISYIDTDDTPRAVRYRAHAAERVGRLT